MDLFRDPSLSVVPLEEAVPGVEFWVVPNHGSEDSKSGLHGTAMGQLLMQSHEAFQGGHFLGWIVGLHISHKESGRHRCWIALVIGLETRH